MSNFLSWSTVDATIQSEMAQQAPAEAQRLEAINNELLNLNNKYDLETGIRAVTINVIPDGTAYSLETIVGDTDIKKPDDIMISADDDPREEFLWIDRNLLERKIAASDFQNVYTTYWEDGVSYFKMLSSKNETALTDFKLKYFTSDLAIKSGTLQALVEAVSTSYILLPPHFKDLIVYGAVKRLLYQAIGDDGNTQLAIIRNRYKSELTRLGLDDSVKAIKKKNKSIKLHRNL